jgi:quercetin dioxygenase-like cupin family protein
MDLGKLKALTNELQILTREGSKIEYRTKDDIGKCSGKALYKINEVAVQLGEIAKGTYVENHVHKNEFESIQFFKGKARMAIRENGKCESKIFEAPAFVWLTPGIAHDFEALEDTSVISTTIPASEEYPNVNGEPAE